MGIKTEGYSGQDVGYTTGATVHLLGDPMGEQGNLDLSRSVVVDHFSPHCPLLLLPFFLLLLFSSFRFRPNKAVEL